VQERSYNVHWNRLWRQHLASEHQPFTINMFNGTFILDGNRVMAPSFNETPLNETYQALREVGQIAEYSTIKFVRVKIIFIHISMCLKKNIYIIFNIYIKFGNIYLYLLCYNFDTVIDANCNIVEHRVEGYYLVVSVLRTWFVQFLYDNTKRHFAISPYHRTDRNLRGRYIFCTRWSTLSGRRQ